MLKLIVYAAFLTLALLPLADHPFWMVFVGVFGLAFIDALFANIVIAANEAIEVSDE